MDTNPQWREIYKKFNTEEFFNESTDELKYEKPLLELVKLIIPLVDTIIGVHDQFTWHGVTHSINILTIIEKIIARQKNDFDNSWRNLCKKIEYFTNPETGFVLCASALLHDVGMLWNIEENRFEFEAHKFLKDDLRKKHHKATSHFLEYCNSVYDKNTNHEDDAPFRKVREILGDNWTTVSTICRSHASTDWSGESNRPQYISVLDEKPFDYIYRVPILFISALIRIGDLLDYENRENPWKDGFLSPESHLHNITQKCVNILITPDSGLEAADTEDIKKGYIVLKTQFPKELKNLLHNFVIDEYLFKWGRDNVLIEALKKGGINVDLKLSKRNNQYPPEEITLNDQYRKKIINSWGFKRFFLKSIVSKEVWDEWKVKTPTYIEKALENLDICCLPSNDCFKNKTNTVESERKQGKFNKKALIGMEYTGKTVIGLYEIWKGFTNHAFDEKIPKIFRYVPNPGFGEHFRHNKDNFIAYKKVIIDGPAIEQSWKETIEKINNETDKACEVLVLANISDRDEIYLQIKDNENWRLCSLYENPSHEPKSNEIYYNTDKRKKFFKDLIDEYRRKKLLECKDHEYDNALKLIEDFNLPIEIIRWLENTVKNYSSLKESCNYTSTEDFRINAVKYYLKNNLISIVNDFETDKEHPLKAIIILAYFIFNIDALNFKDDNEEDLFELIETFSEKSHLIGRKKIDRELIREVKDKFEKKYNVSDSKYLFSQIKNALFSDLIIFSVCYFLMSWIKDKKQWLKCLVYIYEGQYKKFHETHQSYITEVLQNKNIPISKRYDIVRDWSECCINEGEDSITNYWKFIKKKKIEQHLRSQSIREATIQMLLNDKNYVLEKTDNILNKYIRGSDAYVAFGFLEGCFKILKENKSKIIYNGFINLFKRLMSEDILDKDDMELFRNWACDTILKYTRDKTINAKDAFALIRLITEKNSNWEGWVFIGSLIHTPDDQSVRKYFRGEINKIKKEKDCNDLPSSGQIVEPMKWRWELRKAMAELESERTIKPEKRNINKRYIERKILKKILDLVSKDNDKIKSILSIFLINDSGHFEKDEIDRLYTNYFIRKYESNDTKRIACVDEIKKYYNLK